jgi:transcriptional regulator
MQVEEIEGTFKLNQHKSDADHTAIALAMMRQSDDAAQQIGKQMVALRPQLDYKSVVPVSASAESRNVP